MMTRPRFLTAYLVAGTFGCATTGCKPKKMSQAQICKKGCEYRLACIEELELDKAVTDANRAFIQQNQQKKHDGFIKFCVNACNQGQSKGQSKSRIHITKRMRGYATCGVKAKTCSAFFKCAQKVEKAGKRTKGDSQRK